MVGIGERDEALGMFGRREDLARVVDPDGGVDRRMKDEQRLAQVFDALEQPLLGDIVEKLAPDSESPPADLLLRRRPRGWPRPDPGTIRSRGRDRKAPRW